MFVDYSSLSQFTEINTNFADRYQDLLFMENLVGAEDKLYFLQVRNACFPAVQELHKKDFRKNIHWIEYIFALCESIQQIKDCMEDLLQCPTLYMVEFDLPGCSYEDSCRLSPHDPIKKSIVEVYTYLTHMRSKVTNNLRNLIIAQKPFPPYSNLSHTQRLLFGDYIANQLEAVRARTDVLIIPKTFSTVYINLVSKNGSIRSDFHAKFYKWGPPGTENTLDTIEASKLRAAPIRTQIITIWREGLPESSLDCYSDYLQAPAVNRLSEGETTIILHGIQERLRLRNEKMKATSKTGTSNHNAPDNNSDAEPADIFERLFGCSERPQDRKLRRKEKRTRASKHEEQTKETLCNAPKGVLNERNPNALKISETEELLSIHRSLNDVSAIESEKGFCENFSIQSKDIHKSNHCLHSKFADNAQVVPSKNQIDSKNMPYPDEEVIPLKRPQSLSNNVPSKINPAVTGTINHEQINVIENHINSKGGPPLTHSNKDVAIERGLNTENIEHEQEHCVQLEICSKNECPGDKSTVNHEGFSMYEFSEVAKNMELIKSHQAQVSQKNESLIDGDVISRDTSQTSLNKKSILNECSHNKNSCREQRNSSSVQIYSIDFDASQENELRSDMLYLNISRTSSKNVDSMDCIPDTSKATSPTISMDAPSIHSCAKFKHDDLTSSRIAPSAGTDIFYRKNAAGHSNEAFHRNEVPKFECTSPSPLMNAFLIESRSKAINNSQTPPKDSSFTNGFLHFRKGSSHLVEDAMFEYNKSGHPNECQTAKPLICPSFTSSICPPRPIDLNMSKYQYSAYLPQANNSKNPEFSLNNRSSRRHSSRLRKFHISSAFSSRTRSTVENTKISEELDYDELDPLLSTISFRKFLKLKFRKMRKDMHYYSDVAKYCMHDFRENPYVID